MSNTGVKVMDYTLQVMRQLEGNKRRALTALGMEAVTQIQNGMDTLYGKPIWDTGTLRGEVHYAVNNSAPNTVDVGNATRYAHFVHDGTYKMKARPYIRDSLTGEFATERMKEVLTAYLKQGFDG